MTKRIVQSHARALAGTVMVLLMSVSCLAVVGATSSEAMPGAQLSDMLEAHPLTTLDGRTGRLVPAAAPVSVVHFWASWCAPCKKELPLLDDLASELLPAGVRFAAISIDSDPARARRFIERHEIAMPVFLDGPDGLAESLSLSNVPSTFVLDREGRVTFATVGSSEEEIARLRAHLLAQARRGNVAENH